MKKKYPSGPSLPGFENCNLLEKVPYSEPNSDSLSIRAITDLTKIQLNKVEYAYFRILLKNILILIIILTLLD
jgi:hypothetical protein